MANDNWITPPKIVERARDFLGGFDLDPASSGMAQKLIKANTWCGCRHKDKALRDGLQIDWSEYKTVWLNPPYSQPSMSQFVDKTICQMPNGLLLTNASFDTSWAHKLLKDAIAVLFTRGRLGFMTNSFEIALPPDGDVEVEVDDGVVTARYFDVDGKTKSKRFKHQAITPKTRVTTKRVGEVIELHFPFLIPVAGNRVGQALWYIRDIDKVTKSNFKEFSDSIDKFRAMFREFGTVVELGELP